MFIKGGRGSGNWGHIGRPGLTGGSAGMSNTPADKIFAGGQKYKEVAGNRSVTTQRKVTYQSKTKEKEETPKEEQGQPSPTAKTGKEKIINQAQEIIDSNDSIYEKSKKIKDLHYEALSTTAKNQLGLTKDDLSELAVYFSNESSKIKEKMDSQFSSEIDKILSEPDVNIKKQKLLQLEYNYNNGYVTPSWPSNKKIIQDSIKEIATNSLASSDNQQLSGDISLDGYQKFYSNARSELDEITSKANDEQFSSQTQGVRYYQNTGDWIVNNYLREGSLPYPDEKVRFKLDITDENPSREAVQMAIESKRDMMDRAMTNTLSKPTVLTRWVGKGHPLVDAIRDGKSVVGTVYSESGYSSTSMNTNFKWMKGEIRIQIKTPKGTKGLAFGSQHPLMYVDELEFLLPRNSAFKVSGYDPDSQTVVVELIDNGVLP